MKTSYLAEAPQRAEIDASKGPVLLEFGANWCGHCMAAQPPLEQAFAGAGSVTHYKVEDGPGRPLGRSFRVKLWPTFIFLLDGEEKARVVRPLRAEELSVGFAQIDP
ncbi:thioredoxin [Duganella sp. FT109W]|uniref:Thioredoxin n=1 Tax=Duganella margarita TaxID=2692170 RepID=A0ABW9WFP2_9BURK|nr:thioredoxin family protein [Duganella margarita]MYN39630.1 thioredoxin [Duganella margarita]